MKWRTRSRDRAAGARPARAGPTAAGPAPGLISRSDGLSWASQPRDVDGGCGNGRAGDFGGCQQRNDGDGPVAVQTVAGCDRRKPVPRAATNKPAVHWCVSSGRLQVLWPQAFGVLSVPFGLTSEFGVLAASPRAVDLTGAGKGGELALEGGAFALVEDEFDALGAAPAGGRAVDLAGTGQRGERGSTDHTLPGVGRVLARVSVDGQVRRHRC